jgi:hypothetical protein
VPATFTDAPNMFGSYSQAVPGTSGDVSSWSSIVPGGTCTVTVTNKDVANKILSLTFSGTFLLSLGPGAASIEVTEGVCKTHFTAVF